jgi:hypothetical protein
MQIEIVALGICLVSVLMMGYVVVIKRQVSRSEQLLSGRVDELSKEVKALGNSSIGIGRKALSLEDRLESLRNQLEVMRKNDPASVSYSEAMRLVELGAEVEDLMETCGISRPEAELVSALSQHRQDQVPTLRTSV